MPNKSSNYEDHYNSSNQDWNDRSERNHNRDNYNQSMYGSERNLNNPSRTDRTDIGFVGDSGRGSRYDDREYQDSQYGTLGTFGDRRNDFNYDYNYRNNTATDRRKRFWNTMNHGNNYGSPEWGRHYESHDYNRVNINSGNFGDFNRGSYGNVNRDYDDYRRIQNSNRHIDYDGGYSSNGNRSNEGWNRNDEHYLSTRNNYGYGDDHDYDHRRWINRSESDMNSLERDVERRRNADAEHYNSHRGKGPRNYKRSPERIQEDVCDRLTDDDLLDATDISVQIQEDEVILTGTVNNREQKRRAEDLVESISGVRNVENRLKVEPNFSRRNDYTGTTDRAGGIGRSSGTMNEIIRDTNKDELKD